MPNEGNKNATPDHPKRHTGNERRMQGDPPAIALRSCYQAARPLPAGLLLFNSWLINMVLLELKSLVSFLTPLQLLPKA